MKEAAPAAFLGSIMVVTMVFLVGCCGPQPTEQATMPAAYINEMPVSKLKNGEMTYACTSLLVVGKDTKVWIKDVGAIQHPPRDEKAFLTVWRAEDKYYVVVQGKSSFSLDDTDKIKTNLLPVARVVVKADTKELACEDFDKIFKVASNE